MRDAVTQAFAAALQLEFADYAFRARMPARDHVYVVVWQYEALPEALPEIMALAAWLCAVGEEMPAMTSIRYAGGLVHRRPS